MSINTLKSLELEMVAALSAIQAGHVNPLKAASAAGLLSRYQGAVVPKEAIEWRDGEGSALLDTALSSVNRDDLVDRIVDMSEEHSVDDKLEALLAFDAFCAAAHWCDIAPITESSARLISRTIIAFPEPWTQLVEMASTLLAESPPNIGDPARQVWESVEATSWSRAEERSALYFDGFETTGLILSLSIEDIGHPIYAQRAQAAEELPEAPLWQTIRKTKEWELAITTNSTRELVFQLHIATTIPISVKHDGVDVQLDELRSGVWTCPALKGDYSWAIDDVHFDLQVTA